MKITFQNRSPLYAGPWGFLAQVIVMTLACLLAAWLIPAVSFTSVGAAIITAIIISLLNNFIRPILIVLTLPFMILTLGLFLFIINTIIIVLADAMVQGFTTGGFVNALFFSVLLTLINYLLEIPNRMMRRPKFNDDDSVPVQPRQIDDSEEYADYEEIKDEE